jgi:hypothetical protein
MHNFVSPRFLSERWRIFGLHRGENDTGFFFDLGLSFVNRGFGAEEMISGTHVSHSRNISWRD